MASVVDSSGGMYTSITLDDSGKAYISYYDADDGDLEYATNAFGMWLTSTVDSSGEVGQYTSISLDSTGKAHISYYDSTNHDLKYATNASGTWVINTVDSSGKVGEYTSMTLDSLGKAHISYYDSTSGDLKYAYGTIDDTPTPTPKASPTPSPSPAPSQTPKASPTPTPQPTLSPFPTPARCSASSITAFPFSLVINKSKTYKNAITVWVMGEGGCLVPNAKVKAKLDPAGKKILTVKPSSRKTDRLGVASFSIKTKNKAGNATITFSTQGVGISIITIASVVVTE